LAVAGLAHAQPGNKGPRNNNIQWQPGPTVGTFSDIAEIKLVAGFKFTGVEGAHEIERRNGNRNPTALGIVAPANLDPEGPKGFLVYFDFQNIGYVKDDERNKLDANAILNELKAGQEQQNADLQQQGLAPITIVGWQQPPAYDEETHNLTWCVRAQSQGQDLINYKTKILGREGVMDVVLACDPAHLNTILPKYKTLLKNFSFKPGKKYEEFKQGDRMAEYGLAALIGGAGLAAAAKTGLLSKLFLLFAKLGKGAILIVVAIGAGIVGAVRWVFNLLTGNKPSQSESASQEHST
jgi:uncharacterized membrane-anchored protein